MKEVSETNQNQKTTNTATRIWPISKRWKRISNASHPNNLKALVDTRIIQYELVLNKVKELYTYTGEVYYQRDFKDDNENPFTIYSFLTSGFWWNIECDLIYQINVEYEFYSCPFEDEIKELFRQFNLTEYITEVKKEPSLAAFHKAVIAYQQSQYIHTFN
jgi:hypothetical protein